MKKMKNLIGFSLCFLLITACAVPVMADEAESLPSTGLIFDTWESYLEEMNESTLRALTTYRSGDLDGDGKVTASDARLCLRSVAYLEELTENQREAADVDDNTIVNTSDARKILRAAANLETLKDTAITTTLDWGFVIGPLKTAGSGRYYWQYRMSKEGLEVSEQSIDTSSPEIDGAPVEQFFLFTPKTAGTYTVTFTLTDSRQETILDEFQVNILVHAESIVLSEGESYRLEGLQTAGSGRYIWTYSVTPEAGIDVQETIRHMENEVEGTPVEQIFTLTGKESGLYTVHFELTATGEEKAINEFSLDILVE